MKRPRVEIVERGISLSCIVLCLSFEASLSNPLLKRKSFLASHVFLKVLILCVRCDIVGASETFPRESCRIASLRAHARYSFTLTPLTRSIKPQNMGVVDT